MSQLVSLITATFNRGRMLSDLWASIKKQDYQNFEWVIVDDGSTDRTANIVGRWKDSRILYVKLPKNRGTSFAKNEGIIRSSGDFIAPIDSDDMLTTESVSVRVSRLKSDGRRLWIHGRAIELRNKNDRKPHTIMHDRWLAQRAKPETECFDPEHYYRCVHANTVMMRREFFERLGLYDESLMRCEDKELWRRALLFGILPLYTKKFVCLYRFHSGQITVVDKDQQDKFRKLSCERAEMRFSQGINSQNTRLLSLAKDK